MLFPLISPSNLNFIACITSGDLTSELSHPSDWFAWPVFKESISDHLCACCVYKPFRPYHELFISLRNVLIWRRIKLICTTQLNLLKLLKAVQNFSSDLETDFLSQFCLHWGDVLDPWWSSQHLHSVENQWIRHSWLFQIKFVSRIFILMHFSVTEHLSSLATPFSTFKGINHLSILNDNCELLYCL